MYFTETETETERLAREDREVEVALKVFFQDQEEAERKLTEINSAITALGRKYWKYRGYTVMPRIERLRAAILGA